MIVAFVGIGKEWLGVHVPFSGKASFDVAVGDLRISPATASELSVDVGPYDAIAQHCNAVFIVEYSAAASGQSCLIGDQVAVCKYGDAAEAVERPATGPDRNTP